MRHAKKKLLVATVGLAAISYIGCAEKPIQTGNLMAQPPQPQPSASPSGESSDAGAAAVAATTDAGVSSLDSGKMTPLPPDDHRFRTGNLMPPPPPPPSSSAKKK